MRVVDLRDLLRTKGLSASGNKKVLIERLIENGVHPDIEESQPAVSSPANDVKADNNGPSATLIVCPTSVLSNWELQIASHVRDEINIKVHVHHGAQRCSDTAFLSKFDIGSYYDIGSHLCTALDH